MTRQQRFARRAAMTISAIALFAAGCNLFSLQLGGGTGSVRLVVTDKPFPYEFIESAVVTINEIKVRRVDNDAPSNDSADNANENSNDDDGGGFVTIFEGDRDIDLLELRNGRTDLLTETSVPSGSYDEMRLVVTRGILVLSDDREFDLSVPSGSSSGIKLKFDFDVADGESKVLLLDVDLSRAFSAIPSGMIDDVTTIREFRFRPAFAMRLIDLLEAGSISGNVQNESGQPLENVAVTAYDDDDIEVTSTASEADGSFVLFGLPTGTYRVEFSAAGFDDTERTGVSVSAESDTSVGDVVLSETAVSASS